MRAGNTFWILSVAVLAICVSVTSAGASTSSLQEMADMSEKMDQVEKQDFQAAIEKASRCTRARDFSCTDVQLEKATKLAGSAEDRYALAQVRVNMAQEKEHMAEEARQRAEEERRRAEAEEKQRIALAEQRRQQEAASQSGGFQWSKLAALGVGAAIGGIGNLSAEDQTRFITSAVKDSMAGQEGISNLQESVRASNAATANSGTGQGGSKGGVSKATFDAGELACQKEADQNARPYGDSQLDTFCVLAASNACVKRKFNFDGYEAERQKTCKGLKESARALNVSPNKCSACP